MFIPSCCTHAYELLTRVNPTPYAHASICPHYDVPERKVNHTLLYLACEQMVFGVNNSKERIGSGDLRENGAQGLDNPMMELCRGVKYLLLEDLCVGVRQLQLEDMNCSQTTPSRWMLFIGAR